MNTVTVKMPEELHAALLAVSKKRKVSKSAVIREALERSLLVQADDAGAAERWVARWRGSLIAPGQPSLHGRVAPKTDDPRLAHLLAKHIHEAQPVRGPDAPAT